MGMSGDWFREAPIRVQRVIDEHFQRGQIDLGLVYAISQEITNEACTESHVFDPARMLGYLPVGVLQDLLH